MAEILSSAPVAALVPVPLRRAPWLPWQTVTLTTWLPDGTQRAFQLHRCPALGLEAASVTVSSPAPRGVLPAQPMPQVPVTSAP